MESSQTAHIIMYHYVRPLKSTRYPAIKALDLADFDRQLDLLEADFVILSMDDFLEANAQGSLPDRAAMLTFDDGFLDHYTYVLPRLVDRGIKASFYPAAAPLLDGSLLDVHRIHFILAASHNVNEVLHELDSALGETMSTQELADLREKWRRPGAFDSAEVNYVKRVLQVGVPLHVRTELCSRLFRRFVSNDERAFVEELYMNEVQLRMMTELGMHIGSHAYTHPFLSTLSAPQQASEIENGMQMLRSVGIDISKGWTMAFPYGDRSAVTHELLRGSACKAAFTDHGGIADTGRDDFLDLPRIDCVSLYS